MSKATGRKLTAADNKSMKASIGLPISALFRGFQMAQNGLQKARQVCRAVIDKIRVVNRRAPVHRDVASAVIILLMHQHCAHAQLMGGGKIARHILKKHRLRGINIKGFDHFWIHIHMGLGNVIGGNNIKHVME